MSIVATRDLRSESGHAFVAIQAIASLAAAPSSSDAASTVTSFSFNEAEKRRSAPVTLRRAGVALMSQWCAVRSLSMTLAMPSRSV